MRPTGPLCAAPYFWHHGRVKHVVGAGAVVVAALLAAGCQHALNPDNGRCGPTPRLVVGSLAFLGGDAGAGVQAQVTWMVLDGSDLYFVVGPVTAPGNPAQATVGATGAVMRVSTFGGTPAAIAGGYSFEPPALTPSTVILGETDPSGTVNIATVARGGGTQTIVATLTGAVLFTPPVTDGTSIFFGDGAGVESVPLAPASVPVTPTRLSPASPNNLAVFGQSLLMLLPTGAIESLPVAAGGDGGAETSLGTSLPSTPRTLIACGSDACWLAGGDLEEMAPAGGAVATTATLTGPLAAPTALVYDGTNFFVAGTAGASTGTGAIARVPRQGGPQVVVATLPSAGPIAVDEACVYFATSTGIFSLQKNAEGIVLP